MASLPSVGKVRVTVGFASDIAPEMVHSHHVCLVGKDGCPIVLKENETDDIDVGAYRVQILSDTKGMVCEETYSFPVQRYHFALGCCVMVDAQDDNGGGRWRIYRKQIDSFSMEKRALASKALELPLVRELVSSGFRGVVVVPSDSGRWFDPLVYSSNDSFVGFRGEAAFNDQSHLLSFGLGGRVVATVFLLHEKLLMVIVG